MAQGNRISAPEHAFPGRRQILPDFTLPTPEGRPVSASDYGGRASLVVVCAGAGRPALALLQELAGLQADLARAEAQVLAVFPGGSPAEAPQAVAADVRASRLLVLMDLDGAVHRALAGSLPNGRPAAALYVTDRFREIFAAFREAEGDALPDAAEVLRWLEFVSIQCEECGGDVWRD